MKMRLMFFAFVIVLLSTGFISAHICSEGKPAGTHGVFINGVCYDCGDATDGVCPEDYGAECGDVRDADCNYVQAIFWSVYQDGRQKFPEDQVLNVDMLDGGKTLYMVIKESGLAAGTNVTFKVEESDGLFGTAKIYSVNATVQNTADKRVIAALPIKDSVADLIEDENQDELMGGLGDFYFIASRADGLAWPADFDQQSDTININITYGGNVYLTCTDYTDNDSCTNDNSGVGAREVSRQVDSCTYLSNGFCYWNSTDICVQKQSAEIIVEGTPETCEGGRRTGPCEYPKEERYGSCETGDEFYRVRYVSNDPVACPSFETQPIPCPKTLKLPFFGIYGIVTSLSIISLIYFLYRKKFNL